ncbi:MULTISPECIES: P1 family peptidase [Gordonibacter]|uniref:P1 family peptidase n=1 Tax=Gordonibacter faecis TaxID=3047475 RepID=A0ABT7DI31_9ACTN|nr:MULTISPECIES: P1 family peptidase [unclassified Gordonibacter]MDJ1649182.1 P1 family peptidase [Gordonibacter sp. KGMB12511]HIW76182.1 P1 family peptidase [Candidatus Gordonibacter avicola]
MLHTASLTDLSAFHCGHAHNNDAGTGCTVVVAPAGATCGVDVRGGGPATRETDLLRPENMIEAVHAVVLSGGSAFGLAASTGVMEELATRGIGFEVGGARVPIVVGACLFDLLVGENAHPDAAMGQAACRAALDAAPGAVLAEGNVGAGTGASVGKLLGPERAMKAGFGVCGLRMGEVVACALVAVNALGTVRGADGTWIAGCRNDAGQVMEPLEAFAALASAGAGAGAEAGTAPCTNTTIGVVLTNARLTKAQAKKVSSTTHDAYARAIKPVHTLNDGDTIFTFASGEVDASPDAVAILATEAMQGAIERAVLTATSAYGLPAASDLPAAH